MNVWRKSAWGIAWLSLLLCQCKSDSKPAPKHDQTKTNSQHEAARHGLTAEEASKVLFEVGDRRITLGEFADALHDQSPYLRARYTSPERRREFLENMIRFELLAQEAKKRHHDNDPEVVKTQEEVMIEALMSKLFDEEVIKPEAITEADISAYYQAHREDFRKPAQVRASQVVLKTETQAKRVLAAALEDPEDMDTFANLAFSQSIDPATRVRMGDMRFFSASPDNASAEVPEEVRKAAFSLKEIGDVYPEPIATPAGFVVLKLTAKRDAFDRSLEDATAIIRNKLWRQRRETAIEHFVESLRKKAHIKENLSLLASIPLGDSQKEGTSSAP